LRTSSKLVAVFSAYNAERTLAATLAELPPGCVDECLLVDDASTDRTVELAGQMGLDVIAHPEKRGFGANQKPATAMHWGAAQKSSS
jgi:glycosyltransferase involved in cell wall biosynthesis